MQSDQAVSSSSSQTQNPIPLPTAPTTTTTGNESTPPATSPPQAVPVEISVTLINERAIDDYFKESETRFADLEKVLNSGDRIPILSLLSGAVRTFLGAVQVIWYLAKAAINGLVSICKKGDDKENRLNFASREIELVKHGLANIVRGTLFVGMPIVSNIFAWVNDHYLDQRFAYPTETTARTTYKLFHPGSNLADTKAARHELQLQLARAAVQQTARKKEQNRINTI